jgi:hypothetical protein
VRGTYVLLAPAEAYIALQTLADGVYDDVEEFGDGRWTRTAAVLDLSPFTWICDGAWRRRAARS